METIDDEIAARSVISCSACTMSVDVFHLG